MFWIESMSNNAVIALSMVLALSLQAGCVTKAATSSCSVTGVKNLSPQTGEADLCRSFENVLTAELAGLGASEKASGLKIAIDLTRKGSAEARVTAGDGSNARDYPVVGVDVMDRPLGRRDVDQLAKVVAKMLADR